jgi:hypothetical protein
MGLLDKLWDDVAGGSPPDKGLKQLRKEKSGKGAQVTGGMSRYKRALFESVQHFV